MAKRFLTQEQATELNKKLSDLKDEVENIFKAKANDPLFDNQSLIYKLSTLNAEIINIQDALSNSSVIKNKASDKKVSIGTTFNALINNKLQKTFTLVSQKVSNEERFDASIISLDSPLGKAVYEKQVGDVCNYKSGNGMIHSCEVLDIVAEKEDDKPKVKVK